VAWAKVGRIVNIVWGVVVAVAFERRLTLEAAAWLSKKRVEIVVWGEAAEGSRLKSMSASTTKAGRSRS
jgi:hypothetical protein